VRRAFVWPASPARPARTPRDPDLRDLAVDSSVDPKYAMSQPAEGGTGRGLHSSTSPLNFSASCGIEGVFRGGLWGVHVVLGGIMGCL